MSDARKRLAERNDLSLPANQRKLDAAEQLAQVADEAGIHSSSSPSRSAIIGPRTMEDLKSQLPAADVIVDQALLDRIEIVPPGTNINPADGGWASPALEPAARRR
jgi:aryl-alcohol dehydrogenase-like predicted oxidoreductase